MVLSFSNINSVCKPIVLRADSSREWFKWMAVSLNGWDSRYGLIISALSLFLIFSLPGMVYGKTLSYSIQIGAYKELSSAEAEAERLIKAGHDTFSLHGGNQGEEMLYRVYVQKFESKNEAQTEAARLVELGVISNYYVASLDNGQGPEMDYPATEQRGIPKTLNAPASEISSHNQLNNETTGNVSSKDSDLPNPKSPGSDSTSNEPQEEPRQTGEDSDVRPAIRDITFEIDEGTKESAFIHLTHYYWPCVTFYHQGESPRLVIDLKNIIPSNKVVSEIPVNGNFIKQIHTQLQEDTNRMRVMLVLNAADGYKVSQVFNDTENIYAVEIGPEDRAEQKKNAP